MSGDVGRHELDEVLSVVQEQMRDLSVMQAKRSELTAKAFAADQLVAVTVDAQCVVSEVVIDEGYLEEFELAELGGHVITAARAAAEQIRERSAQLLAPLIERRKEVSGLSGVLPDMPDLAQVLSNLGVSELGIDQPGAGSGESGGGADGGRFPVVKR
jgi:DNA-binding protein YbaB